MNAAQRTALLHRIRTNAEQHHEVAKLDAKPFGEATNRRIRQLGRFLGVSKILRRRNYPRRNSAGAILSSTRPVVKVYR